MRSHRTHFLRFLLQSEPGELAIANGLRAALALGVPMLIGQFTEQRQSGLFIALMAFSVNMTNIGGPYWIKATVMAAATLGIAVSAFVGTLVGGVPALAVVLTFLWGLGSGFASLYANGGANVGLVIGISFISTIAQSGDLNLALMRSLFCLIAGGWAMLLSLVMWPFTPYKPLRTAVAECFSAIANYIQAFPAKTTGTENILKIREALETARTALGTARLGQQARSWMDEQLLVLIEHGDCLLGSVIALIELLEVNLEYQQYRAVQRLVDDALAQLSLSLQAIAKVISGKAASIDFGNLHRIHEALKEQENLQRQAISGSETDYTTLVALTNLVLMLEKLLKQLQHTAEIAKSLETDSKIRNRDVEPILVVVEQQRSLLSLLQDNLTSDSAIFRHALRIGVTLALGVTIYSITKLPMGYWVTLTILLVLKPNFGATFQRFFQRVGGTIFGVVLAAVLAATITSKSVLEIIIVLTVFFGISLISINYGYAVVFLSIFVLLITDIAHPIGWQFSGLRVLNTLIGAGLAFGSHYLMWPNWERQHLPNQLATALQQCRNYFIDVMAVYQGTKERDTIIAQRRQTGLAIGNAQATFQGLLREPQVQIELVEPMMTLLAYMGRFINAVTVLAVHLEHFQGTQPLPELESFVRQIALLLEQLADAVQQEIAPPPLPDLDQTLQKIQPQLEALRTARIQELTVNQGHTPVRQAVIDYSILDIEIDEIVRRVTAMHSAIVRLSMLNTKAIA
ncbi:FUSC family protein [Nostoc sp. UHCC 0302]|uniref:FUSC family protein n=1 Tax=Nostoc sp. UHCC 0302 TaxID=3134896 RepID=UPI00311CDFBB